MLTSVRPADVIFEINLSAIQPNFHTISALVGPQVRVAAVVKCDAYGLGLLRVAGALIDAGCDLLFVGNLHEALLLRSSHTGAAVAVLCDEFARYGGDYRSNGLIPVVNNCFELDAIGTAGDPQAYFLSIETRLSRLSLAFDDLRRKYLSGSFKQHPPSVVLSHLACSERVGDAMNMLQRNRFLAMSDVLKPTLRSLAASAGFWLGTPYHFDIARVGSALYGLNNAGIRPNPLKPVASRRAKTLDVRKVARRKAVGYGGTFRTAQASRIASVGIGYKHGLPWGRANKVSVRLAGYSAPLIGRMSMEYTTIDITDVPEALCGPGSCVELLGEDLTVDDLAAASGIYPQEVLTRLGVGCARQMRVLATIRAPSLAGAKRPDCRVSR
ncbi:alanine racemase [Mesorhizobium shangrilense]|uniref:Alanine racemase n=1 Tax=Mesorhizobium shangrilense TaxID=460060 RepID=A0ABV2DSF8_9HYPH